MLKCCIVREMQVKKIDIKKLSKKYSVRKLNLDDVQMIYTFCKRNIQYYKYCGKELSIELIEKDLEITPPSIPIEQKYYIGFQKCQLGIDKNNPQSNHFWRKNGFEVMREVEIEEGIILVAERQL